MKAIHSEHLRALQNWIAVKEFELSYHSGCVYIVIKMVSAI